ncbi:MAG: hypothetical protein NT040_05590 [Bacteroidetes bacterium]|nr:hypothetical protein [Bacteroidota bacterium]
MNWKASLKAPSAQFFADSLLIFLSAIVLCNMAFYNQFPLFFSDTGTHLWTAFWEYKPIDRPLFYGVFMKHASLMTSLWLIVLAQALAVAIPLFYCFKYFSGTPKFRVYYLAYIFLITFFTGASINVGQLIPDVFTPVAVLCIALFLFAPKLKVVETIVTSCIFILAVGVHNSHFIITTLILLIFLSAFIFKKTRLVLQRAQVKLMRILFALMLVASSYVLVSTIQYNAGLKFAVSRYGHVFFMARLYDCGILEQYLQDACPKYHFHLCSEQGKFPWDFVWDYTNSPLYKNGGWEGNRDEFNAIIRDILTTPKYWPRLISREVEATVKQFFSFRTGDTGPELEGSSSITAIRSHWPESVKEFFQGKQQRKYLDWTMLNLFQSYLIYFLFFCTMLVYFVPGFNPKYKMFLTYVLIALLVNAFACGAISGVVERYQSRVIWLLPLPFMLYLANRGVSFSRLKNFFSDPNRSET